MICTKLTQEDIDHLKLIEKLEDDKRKSISMLTLEDDLDLTMPLITKTTNPLHL